MGYALRQDDFLSPEDYLWREQHAVDAKHEYVNGRIYAMAGASRRHNQIAIRLLTQLHTRVAGSRCEVFGSDMKLAIRRPGDVRFYYPDLQVSCEEESEEYYNTRPILVAEVLSESTARIDRGEKLEAYKGIPSVQCILLISLEPEKVELYARKQGFEGWVYGKEDTLPLECLKLELPVAAIFEG